MEGGNAASEASGITLSPERRTKRTKRAKQTDAAENLSGSRTKSAEEISREVRKVREVLKELLSVRAVVRESKKL